jgi:hypothetical protein
VDRDRERPEGIKPFPDTGSFEMKRGDRHNLVMILQIMLDVLKLYYDDFGSVGVCGVFDEATEEAVLGVFTGPDGGPLWSGGLARRIRAVLVAAREVDGCERLVRCNLIVDTGVTGWAHPLLQKTITMTSNL